MMDEAKRKIMVVDDDSELREIMEDALSDAGYGVVAVASAEAGFDLILSEPYSLVITDYILPGGMDGLKFVSKLRDASPQTDVILVTGHSSVESAVKALKMGAFDYITKPFDPQELVATVNRVFAYRELENENRRLRINLADREGESMLVVGRSEAMRRAMGAVRSVAPMPTSVLIRGESGTGKELIAEEIHRLSPRAGGPLVKVNCAALPETLLEDELFGHEKGSFTGAMNKRIGRFEEADKGTIFLDEIGEMNPLLQAKLLRVLQERCFQRIGSNKTHIVDVRVICATNKDLEAGVAEGTFREDLYYRVNVVQLSLPPLRERREDIPALAEALARRISLRLGIPCKPFSTEALDKLATMEFPGNVRELQNLIERALIFSQGARINSADISLEAEGPLPNDNSEPCEETEAQDLNWVDSGSLSTLEDIEKEAIRRTLIITGGNMYKAAKTLGISRSTLYSKVKKLGLEGTGKDRQAGTYASVT